MQTAESQAASEELPPAEMPDITTRVESIFAAGWYLAQNPDVAAAGVNAWEHYTRHGARERRAPHPLFDSNWYVSQNPGVAETGMHPLEHYLKCGAGEGRDPHPLFDSAWYCGRNAGVAASGLTPLEHYIKDGESDARPTSACISEKIWNLKHDRSAWPPAMIPTAEKGIVISASGRFFQLLHANIRNIRQTGCDLPIDVWHLPGEFSAAQTRVLGAMATLVEAGDTPFSGLSGQHTVHGFKAWMLSQSRFRKTLMLDADSLPLQDVGMIFQSRQSCILWRDGPWKLYHRKIGDLRRALDLKVHAFEFESGQVYVDREIAGVNDAVRLAAALNTLGWRLYNHTYGDKETYALAFDLLGEPFAIAPDCAIRSVGGTALAAVQPWLDGTPLFYHSLNKESWWTYKEEWTLLKQEAMEAEALCR